MKLSSPNLDDETSSDKINQNGKIHFTAFLQRKIWQIYFESWEFLYF